VNYSALVFWEGGKKIWNTTVKKMTNSYIGIQNTRIFTKNKTRAMTTKLTLTMNDYIITAAKEYAKNEGKSLSDIVENYLTSLTTNEKSEEDISPKILKLMGTINLTEEGDYKKTLTKSLAKKFK
jgi:hypothetical protein